jgi:hypothetical protein
MVTGRAHYRLTLTGRHFSLTPLHVQIDAVCTIGACSNRASHRLLSRSTASVERMCDHHALEWARDRGVTIAAAGLHDLMLDDIREPRTGAKQER